jgi:hypothetical protein
VTAAHHPARPPISLPAFTGPRPQRQQVGRLVRAVLEGQEGTAKALLADLDDKVREAQRGLPPELERVEAAREPLIDALKAAIYGRLLLDLRRAGWSVQEELGRLFLIPPKVDRAASDDELSAAKQATRGAMTGRVEEALCRPRTATLVADLEPGIGRLMADPVALAGALEAEGPSAIRPFIEPARRSDGDDPTTGLPRYSIFTYMRWWWSFPYNDTPGRSIPFLIRDAGQPGAPVCGLLCLASPVLRMGGRDAALGLSASWLPAVVATLAAAVQGAGALEALADQLGREAGLSRTSLWPQVAGLLGVEDLERWSKRRTREHRAEDATRAAAQLLSDLLSEVETSIALIDQSGMEAELSGAEPDAVVSALRASAELADLTWRESRSAKANPRTRPPGSAPADSPAADSVDAEQPAPGSSRDALFVKKRFKQLARLLQARSRLAAVAERAGADPLAELAAIYKLDLPGERGAPAARRGRRATQAELDVDQRALGVAMEQRRVRLLAGQIAEVTVCGAVPPYNAVLGGKLAALLALSREVTRVWRDAYRDTASDITSKMAGRSVIRPSELAAVTTTGFYGVGNSQYNRAVLPPALGERRWREVGLTAGHGTLHLSDALVAHLGALLEHMREGARLITSKFGEGPSERLRKLRDGMAMAGLPADGILMHGFQRVIFVAPLAGAPPYLEPASPGWSEAGATAAAIADHWRLRWLAGRIARALVDLREPGAAPRLLSDRFPEQLSIARLQLTSGGGPDDGGLCTDDQSGDDTGDEAELQEALLYLSLRGVPPTIVEPSAIQGRPAPGGEDSRPVAEGHR